MSVAIEVKSRTRVNGGLLVRVTHQSAATKTPMTFAVFLPNTGAYPVTNDTTQTPYLMYLSGLTCTDENVCQKSGIFRDLAETGLAFVAPDTSPRGANIPGEDDSWDFGTGAGFYLDATAAPWSQNYRMYTYITEELPAVLAEHFPTLNQDKVGILGHSMGGHGALTIAFKNQHKYKSVSAFAPISHPSKCPWGVKAFTGYFGAEEAESWSNHDATELLQRLGRTVYDDILIDVGLNDSFYLQKQLLPEDLLAVAQTVAQPVTLRFQEGYDHSYYFVGSFIRDHVQFHAARLLA